MRNPRPCFYCLFISLLSWSECLVAQPAPAANGGKLKVQDVYLSTGSVAGFSQTGTLSDFMQLAPESRLLQNNLDGFSQTGEDFTGGSGMFSELLGFQFKDQNQSYNSNPQLRVGFSYTSGSILTDYLWKDMRQPYDTLTSSQTGQIYLVDTITQESYDLNYQTDQVHLEASLIYRTKPEARWSLYGGLGFTAGVSINSFTTVDYYKSSGTSLHNADPSTYYYPVYYSSSGTYQTETHRNKTNTALSVFVPIGVDFRIARKNDFWKRMHLFYEMRPGLLFTFIPETRTVKEAFFQSVFGLRVEIH